MALPEVSRTAERALKPGSGNTCRVQHAVRAEKFGELRSGAGL